MVFETHLDLVRPRPVPPAVSQTPLQRTVTDFPGFGDRVRRRRWRRGEPLRSATGLSTARGVVLQRSYRVAAIPSVSALHLVLDTTTPGVLVLRDLRSSAEGQQ